MTPLPPTYPEHFVAVAHKSLDAAESFLSQFDIVRGPSPDVAGACQVLVIALDAVLTLAGYPRPSAVRRAQGDT